MTRIVALDRGTIGPSVTLTKPAFVHDWVEYDRTRPDQVVERLAGAEIAISNKVPIRRAEIEQLPDLKAIVIPATGYDAFDIAACKERGITMALRSGSCSISARRIGTLLLIAISAPARRSTTWSGRVRSYSTQSCTKAGFVKVTDGPIVPRSKATMRVIARLPKSVSVFCDRSVVLK
ncbi:MAG: hypothetical protein AAFQ44_12585, partial [Pseudomonadota bacterium]